MGEGPIARFIAENRLWIEETTRKGRVDLVLDAAVAAVEPRRRYRRWGSVAEWRRGRG